jgi:hypothetical protein
MAHAGVIPVTGLPSANEANPMKLADLVSGKAD